MRGVECMLLHNDGTYVKFYFEKTAYYVAKVVNTTNHLGLFSVVPVYSQFCIMMAHMFSFIAVKEHTSEGPEYNQSFGTIFHGPDYMYIQSCIK